MLGSILLFNRVVNWLMLFILGIPSACGLLRLVICFAGTVGFFNRLLTVKKSLVTFVFRVYIRIRGIDVYLV